MVWEGDGAIEEESDDESAIASRRKSALNAHKATPDLKEESEDEKSSEDEYTEMRANQGQVRCYSFFRRLGLMSAYCDTAQQTSTPSFHSIRFRIT